MVLLKEDYGHNMAWWPYFRTPFFYWMTLSKFLLRATVGFLSHPTSLLHVSIQFWSWHFCPYPYSSRHLYDNKGFTTDTIGSHQSVGRGYYDAIDIGKDVDGVTPSATPAVTPIMSQYRHKHPWVFHTFILTNIFIIIFSHWRFHFLYGCSFDDSNILWKTVFVAMCHY